MITRLQNLRRTIAIFLSFCILANCSSYQRIAPNKPEDLVFLNKIMILHHGTNQSLIKCLYADANGITGVLIIETSSTDHYINNKITTKFKQQKIKPRDKIHLYLNSPLYEIGSVADTVKISYSKIETVEIYDKEEGKSIIYGLGNVIFYGGIGFGFLVLIVALLKSSCPFIYVNNDDEYVFTGEIFSGATFPQIERNDYLRLPNITTEKGNYGLIVSNEVKEIQHINLMELIVVDHQKGAEALIDKNGSLHIYSQAKKPVSAINASGNDILPIISHRDSLYYTTGSGQSNDEKPVDYLILNFEKKLDQDSACLLIRAKNNSWLDYSYIVFHDQLGKYYHRWQKKQQKVPAEELYQWSIDQKIPLLVYLKKNGVWEFIDLFNVAGPMAMKDDILPIDLSDVDGEIVSLKLETGFRFWEIDYTALDYGSDIPFSITRIPPVFAQDIDSTDIRDLILKDDKSYYVQESVGDEARIYFKSPEVTYGTDRTVILHSKGFYEILMDPPAFRPRISELKKLYRPLQFTQFSKDYYQQLYQSQLSTNN